MIHYGNVRGNLYSARQQEAPKDAPREYKSKLTKKCCGCGQVLPLKAFKVDALGEYGRYRYCSKCNNAGVKVRLEGRDHDSNPRMWGM